MSVEKDNITIFAPVSGVITPLEQVPDPTFAEKMVGDGLAIDPVEETLRAPCDGTVTQLHPAMHALTITTGDGAEVLMHIGLNTVALKGNGFEAKVGEGYVVKRGDPLIVFDADYIAKNALSLLTMIVITNDKAKVGKLAAGMAESGETAILSVSIPTEPRVEEDPEGTVASEPILILNPDGLHARPSAVLVASAKKFSSAIKLVKEGMEGKAANAKSVVGIMGLSVKRYDRIILKAAGEDAGEAVKTLSALIEAGLGENLHAIPKAEAKAALKSEAEAGLAGALGAGAGAADAGGSGIAKSGDGFGVDRLENAPGAKSGGPGAKTGEESAIKPGEGLGGDLSIMVGVAASPGIVSGAVFQLKAFSAQVDEHGQGAEAELKALDDAVGAALGDLKALVESTRAAGDAGKAAIFTAHQELLEDPALLEEAEEAVKAGKSAAYAWRQSYEAQAAALASLDNELLAGRATDVRDVGERVLRILAGPGGEKAAIPAGSILVAPDLTPSDTANLQKSGALGFCVTGGGATSHASILARAAGIPAVVAAPEKILEIKDGTPAILDGDRGFIKIDPSPEEMERVRTFRERLARERALELAAAMEPAMTIDGRRLKIVANISGVDEAVSIPGLGGDGVGLLRSEFLFLERAQAPGEDEQTETYKAIAKALGPERDLIVRTLDVGGDKPLAYMPLPLEQNPFLGVRGIRLNLLGTDIFKAQVRAILRAAPFTRLGIMFPMVSTKDELLAAKAMVESEREALGGGAEVQIGIMVEVPSAAMMADVLAPEVDFFSVGTNDLTQYTLAMDRGHPRLAKMADALHPAVLRLIKRTCDAARKHGKWVGVCGGVAGDPLATAVLTGLGVDELSVSPAAIPSIKAGVRRLSLAKCQEVAEKAMSLPTAVEVRAYLTEVAEAVKLADAVQAGGQPRPETAETNQAAVTVKPEGAAKLGEGLQASQAAGAAGPLDKKEESQ